MLDLLLETELSEEQRDFAESSRVCAENLLDLMNSTLEFSALSANQITLEEAEFPLLQLLGSLGEEFESKASKKGLRATVDFDKNLPESVIGDAPRLKQLLANILENAVKFTSHGEVEMRADAIVLQDGDVLVTIAIRDTGIGIPANKLDNIFDSFRQLDTGLARRYTGMGLGLAVSQKLAKLMHAEVSVESKLGEGSEFKVSIPLKLSREMSRRYRPNGPQLFRVLLAAENPLDLSVAVHALNKSACRIDTAATGQEAVEAVSGVHYDLILIDLQMAGMNGLETADRIRTQPGYDDVPILALTSNGSLENQDLCTKHGMRGFLPKPVQSSDLLRTFQIYLPPFSGVAARSM